MTTRTAETVHRRRLEAGLSRRELAETIGCRIGAIQSIENAGDLGNWPLRLVARLRQVLALDWAELDESAESSKVEANDVERLGAEIVRTGRLRQLDVQAAGLGEALPEFEEQLLKIGMALSTGGNGEMTLIAAERPTPIPRLFGDVPDRLANGNLTAPEREVVISVIAGTLDVQRLSKAKTRALAALLRAGFISVHSGQHATAGALADALGLPTNPGSRADADPAHS